MVQEAFMMRLRLAIDQAFVTPIGKDVESKEYIATQISAELFKAAGFGGIVYKSLLTDEGFNLALFDLDAADVINCGIFSASSMRFEFKESGNPYFVRPKAATDDNSRTEAANALLKASIEP
ncbi:hypothetical protein AOQ73_27945 [Bradyrhizobium pachyrhizi]|nr:hypothetical protein AOQ73_27945 [Bradyrhizobium pachyrhizi]